MDGVRQLPPPREQYVEIPIQDASDAFLAQEHVEVLGINEHGWLMLRIKHWAKKPYKVTRA